MTPQETAALSAYLGRPIAPCARCSRPCKVADTRTSDARLMRHAAEPAGLCPDCALTDWIKCGDGRILGEILEAQGLHRLLDPRVQQQFGALFVLGHADATLGEIGWQRIIDLWDRPFPKTPRKRK